MRRALATALLSLALIPAALVIAPDEAAACSCMRPAGPVESAQGVEAVFHAKLVSVADAPKSGPQDISGKVFTFDVVRTFKGQLDARVNVNTADNSAACGRSYGDPGSEWLIYARVDQDSGKLHDNLCSRTMSFDQAAEDVAELEANADKLDDAPAQPEQPVDPGPAEPEPEPIQPGQQDPSEGGAVAPDVEPEPTPKPSRCAVVDGEPAGGLAGLLALGLGFAFVRRRRSPLKIR